MTVGFKSDKGLTDFLEEFTQHARFGAPGMWLAGPGEKKAIWLPTNAVVVAVFDDEVKREVLQALLDS